jgi:large subunit ribosomal protein L4
MATATSFTSSGTKSTAKTTLDKSVFGVEVKNHDLLKNAYHTHLANCRSNLARTKTRGEVVGSTKKPWRQKGTGRARFGSRYNPIWRGGGITFGPTGNENYSKKINSKAKRQAIRQALSLAAASNKLIIVDSFSQIDKKTKDMVKFLDKISAKGRILCVVEKKDPEKDKAVRNIDNFKLTSAMYLNAVDILNADSIVLDKKALEMVSNWLGAKK